MNEATIEKRIYWAENAVIVWLMTILCHLMLAFLLKMFNLLDEENYIQLITRPLWASLV